MDTRASPSDPAPLFRGFAGPLPQRSALRERITAAYRVPEQEAVSTLLTQASTPPDVAARANTLALQLARRLRDRKNAAGRAGLVQGLLQEYALSSQEGVALMCLAEALLRIPDAATRDALIRDKIARGHWQEHAGRSPSLFVNAATWGLLLTGKIVSTHSESTLSALLTRLIAKGGEPMIRKGVDMAMRMMGEQFVTGETIAAALEHARAFEAQGFRYSYDMLGEAAMTAEDADRYRQSYEKAIHAIGKASAGRGVYEGPGISIKLSALHPRYARAQYDRVMDELYPVLRHLALLAHRFDIGLNIDAEEADRLELSLDLLEKLCFEPAMAGWNGIGFVVQAYQKRCPFVIDHVIDLARRSGHRLMVRLVKGAYWDSEIKRAQVDGQDGFPVYTRKVYTDVSYLACARKLLAAPDQVYPQFATHNAHSMAAIYTLADPAAYRPGQYEFQCLHGMGEPLYEQVVGRPEDGKLGRPCRIYAPVGTHETLLAYLVRRLLENGANTSFVNRIADPTIAIESLVEDPVAAVDRIAKEEGEAGRPHPAIADPAALYGRARLNSQGMDLSNERTLRSLEALLAESAGIAWRAEPLLAEAPTVPAPAWKPVLNPADHRDVVGQVRAAGEEEIDAALRSATAFAPAWAGHPAAQRAAALERAADLLQARMPQLLGLLVREAGKTCANGVAEVREAIDFLRFYAGQARADFEAATHRPLGPVVCISPWNFPLAIFVGQIAAALAAGNPVLAKPAEQTSLTAAEAVRLLHEAGVPAAALQLVPGRGSTVGARMVADERVQAVMFTGSTEVARSLQRTLAGRLGPTGAPVPLIAETGGQNAMIVDSSALAEQVVGDVVASAFDSAGQRCSALRVLCVQDDVADRVLHMLRGAVAESTVGDPAALRTDIGPVIDAGARDTIEAHIEAMRARGRRVTRLGRHAHEVLGRGSYVVPTVIELGSISELTREVFGPVLHVVRYARRDLDALVAQINATGYGLTLGLHTRIDETIEQVVSHARVGNIYVNRNMVGAVVGVQPFGGEGLSGTGPKAGGPLYMYRLLSARPQDVLARAAGAGLPGSQAEGDAPGTPPAFGSLLEWLSGHRDRRVAARCQALAQRAAPRGARLLAGPTGERNVYSLHPREAALCLAENEDSLLYQTAGALAAGCRAIWPSVPATQALRASLPLDVQELVALASDWTATGVAFDVALHQGSPEDLLAASVRLAQREGPIVGLRPFGLDGEDSPMEALFIERAVSTNTAAAGGNASLMTIA
ncbi:trifunctional transcriptional regulator/proline dehydrogenase/L-glutamate gamma-semialdehyde dehydrogenase [Variovorax sp. JS1663]|uniref:trifunctional transcriptional regulator/proline dehydrogenase/L-glutamate gamma-semialdehyde dehydrogenase n=1 Tax=Variovorax sp. JS1663 TaxID=1851577 RepID=UPI000B3493CD|nr:trifunctional transcriptional regulator/proline dehydrogenase/L-glutamate gamma-semialdehyde dehydrogenase [Variovorax sp. JS1663]OUL99263.1 trifunctional transcriptional regulator/proline dehydrogenase/L-glutamate gamma-semialdehyde dehydrogenase [Variovorax sp. JS1663]